MVRWMCVVKLRDRFTSRELRERLEIDDITLVLRQNRLRWLSLSSANEKTGKKGNNQSKQHGLKMKCCRGKLIAIDSCR